MTGSTTHLVAIDAKEAIVGHCVTCGQQFLAASQEHFDQLVLWHMAEEADAEIEASRARHPSAKRIHEPMATPLLNRWST